MIRAFESIATSTWPTTWAIGVAWAGAVIASAFLNVSDPFLITKVLHGSGADYGLVMGCYGVGLVVASIMVARRGNASV